MKRLRTALKWASVMVSLILLMQTGQLLADEKPAGENVVAKVKPQSTCPVMGGKVNRNIYADVNGYRIYVCCAGCVSKIEEEPDTYIQKIKDAGETPAKAPKVICGKCGEIKGTEACCDKDAAVCTECGLIKGSPGCCKIQKGKDAEMCAKCDQIKGSAECTGACKSKEVGQGCCK